MYDVHLGNFDKHGTKFKKNDVKAAESPFHWPSDI